MNNKIRKLIEETHPDLDFLFATGFDEAIIGVDHMFERIVYSADKCLKILVERDGLDYDEAVQHFEHNVSGSYIGDKTPVWVYTYDDVVDLL